MAWFVGFGVAYLAYGPHRMLPAWLGPTVPAALILAAAVPAGVPANFLVMALVGGGFAALAAWTRWRVRR